MKVQEKSEKAGLKFNIQKTKIMVSGPIRETMETVRDVIFLSSKIAIDGDCSHKIKRCLLLERKAMANQVSVLKSRDMTLPTPVVMYGCESWTVKKAERRIDAFEPWCWRRLLRVPRPARISN